MIKASIYELIKCLTLRQRKTIGEKKNSTRDQEEERNEKMINSCSMKSKQNNTYIFEALFA